MKHLFAKLLVVFVLLLALLVPAAVPTFAQTLPCPVGSIHCLPKHYLPYVCIDKHGHQHRNIRPQYHCVFF